MKKTKKITAISYCLFILSISLFNCSSDKKDDPSPSKLTDAGTFVGNISVTDDPQTQLGYITNAKVSVSINGTAATVKVTGDSGFDREYTGTATTQSSGTFDITLNRQTKPTDKIAGERLVILNNKLTIKIDLANDEVTVKPNPTATTTIVIKGKLQMIGSDLLKQ